MLRALYTAALGMSAQQQGVDNIANNLANANTTGFKRTNLVFQDLLYENVQSAGIEEGVDPASTSSLQIGQGAAAIASVKSFVQGSLNDTGNALDLAMNGDGFLQVKRPDGSIAYTRDGTLTMNADGLIVTQSGLVLEPEIQVPPEVAELRIAQDGQVFVRLQNEPNGFELGQIELARFTNPAGLNPIGGNLYEQTDTSGEPFIGTPGQDGLGTIMQGYLEASNVDVVQEMVNLITAQRAYEINSKMVTTSEQMLQIANQLKS
ncbi:MAG: flagellar basal-body rod protein FlgG [Rhodothermales bacterium]|nr:flagellar basal-body rod protein FlgG [Rhodothermales bacterium]MBO6780485.1 flagellar basal-body rod protein FlgG [Rhodothermales bacterium]